MFWQQCISQRELLLWLCMHHCPSVKHQLLACAEEETEQDKQVGKDWLLKGRINTPYCNGSEPKRYMCNPFRLQRIGHFKRPLLHFQTFDTLMGKEGKKMHSSNTMSCLIKGKWQIWQWLWTKLKFVVIKDPLDLVFHFPNVSESLDSRRTAATNRNDIGAEEEISCWPEPGKRRNTQL